SLITDSTPESASSSSFPDVVILISAPFGIPKDMTPIIDFKLTVLSLLVNKAGQFESEVEISYNDKTVNLKSIMGVMSLWIPNGAEIKRTTLGNDEEEAISGVE